MVGASDALSTSLDRERVLVVGAGKAEPLITSFLSETYPDFSIVSSPTLLSGIAEAAVQPHRAVLAWVGGDEPDMARAVRGLREACGSGTRLVLCCAPEQEPEVIDAVEAGADDYVVYPLDAGEMDRVLGYARASDIERLTELASQGINADDPVGELRRVEGILRGLESSPRELLAAVADMVRAVVPAGGVTVVVEGAVCTSGDAVDRPTLSAPIVSDGRTIGQLNVGEPIDRAFSIEDVERLKLYADLAGSLLQAASTTRRYRRLAMTDECTGLVNRRCFHERLDTILASASGKRMPVTVLLFDVDDFKAYNDNYGHDVGDEILRTVGQLFVTQSRKHDVVARYGGDEFAVIFWDPDGPRIPGSQHPDCALDVLDRVQASLAAADCQVAGSITISGGLATYPWDASDVAGLIKAADDALLTAKRGGKNRVLVFGGE
ncbi:MAG: sensor domain-containing diguanylate cyclase [Planctomycetota bacterium]|jgi:diguanylate cyclase (GGDEF)-like protein